MTNEQRILEELIAVKTDVRWLREQLDNMPARLAVVETRVEERTSPSLRQVYSISGVLSLIMTVLGEIVARKT